MFASDGLGSGRGIEFAPSQPNPSAGRSSAIRRPGDRLAAPPASNAVRGLKLGRVQKKCSPLSVPLSMIKYASGHIGFKMILEAISRLGCLLC
jgi:hypothetical protein